MEEEVYKRILAMVDQLNNLDEQIERLQKLSRELKIATGELKTRCNRGILFAACFPVVMASAVVVAYFIIERLFFA